MTQNGGPAFPTPHTQSEEMHGVAIHSGGSDGMTLRQYYAATAPITMEHALLVWGGSLNFNDDATRKAFLAVWALLRFDYADAMLEAEQ